MPAAFGPADTPVNRILHRRFVRRREAVDRRARRREGMASFPADWDRLMAGPSPAEPVPRVLWMLWVQGEAAAPAMVRRSIDTWREENPGWRLNVLDRDSLEAAAGPLAIPSHASWTAISNIVRLRLIHRHGGVWVDATTLCLRPLDDWIDRAAAGPFFAFARPQPARTLATWLLAGRPGDPLLDAWRRWSETYILSPRPQATYHWCHYTFEWLRVRDRAVDRAWRRTPFVSARGPHVLQRILDGHLAPDEMPQAEEMARLPLFKLSWKKGYELRQIVEAAGRCGAPLRVAA